MQVYLILLFILSTFSANFGQAESNLSGFSMPSYSEFSSRLDWGTFSCDIDQFLKKAKVSGHEAYKNGVARGQDLEVKFETLLKETLYQGIEKVGVVNPKLASHILANVFNPEFKIRYFCDYTSTLNFIGNLANKIAYAGCTPFLGCRINIGHVAFLLGAKDSRFDISNSRVRRYVQFILFHEVLHIYLSPSGNLGHSVKHQPAQKFDPLNFHQYDIVYALMNFAYALVNEEFPRPYQQVRLLKEIYDEKGWTEVIEKKKEELEKKYGAKMINSRALSFDQCLAVLFTDVVDKEITHMDFFTSGFYTLIPENTEKIKKHCAGLPNHNSPHYNFYYSLSQKTHWSRD